MYFSEATSQFIKAHRFQFLQTYNIFRSSNQTNYSTLLNTSLLAMEKILSDIDIVSVEDLSLKLNFSQTLLDIGIGLKNLMDNLTKVKNIKEWEKVDDTLNEIILMKHKIKENSNLLVVSLKSTKRLADFYQLN